MRLSALSLALGVVLVGCGGGSDSVPTAASVGGSGASTSTPTHVSFDNSNYVLASTEAASSALFMMDAPSTV